MKGDAKMATSELKGLNFTVEGNSVTFFDARGARLDNGSWAVNGIFGDALVQVDPDTMLPAIRDCIEGDVKAGNGDKIAQLQLLPRQAMVFFLEGQLTRAHLANATEGPDFIDIPDVEVEGRRLTVRVITKSEYSVATADSDGNVL